MLKALVWKEYREQLPVALAGMAISIVLPFVVLSMVMATMSRADPMDMADVLRFILAVVACLGLGCCGARVAAPTTSTSRSTSATSTGRRRVVSGP